MTLKEWEGEAVEVFPSALLFFYFVENVKAVLGQGESLYKDDFFNFMFFACKKFI